MKTLKRLISSILVLALGFAPTLAQAGQHAAQTSRVGSPVGTIAPLQLPAISLGSGVNTTLIGVGLDVGVKNIEAKTGTAVNVPASFSAPQRPGASLNSDHALPASVQLPGVNVGQNALQPENAAPLSVAPENATSINGAAAETTAAAAVQNFQTAVATQKNGGRVSNVVEKVLGWLKPKSVQTPVVHAMAVDEGQTPLSEHTPLSASTDSGSEKKDGSKEPPSPPPSNDGGEGPGRASLVWRAAIMFITGLVVAQVGVEAWSAAWAKWVQVNYGLDAYTTISMVGMGVSLAAGFVGGWAADKFGLKKTYIASTVLFAATAAATLLLFKAGMLTLPVLIGLAAFRTFVGSAGRTAEQTIPIAIFKDNKAALGKFNSISQFILEFAGIGVPFMIGSLLGVFGPLGTMALLPITALLAVGVFFFVKMGEVKKNKNLTGPAKPDPRLLKIGMWAYPAVAVLNMLLYAIIAIGYGNFVHPGTLPVDQAAAAGVAGKIVALYSVGGLIAAGILSGIPGQLWKWIRGKFPKATRFAARFEKAEEQTDDHTREVKSAAKWLILSAVGLLGFVPMLWTSPLIAALAMIPFGIANVMSTLQLLTLVQQNAPMEKKGKIMGTLRTVTTLLSAAGLFGFSYLFKHYPGSTFPFMVFLGVLAVMGAYYVWMSRKLKGTLTSK